MKKLFIRTIYNLLQNVRQTIDKNELTGRFTSTRNYSLTYVKSFGFNIFPTEISIKATI